MRRALNTMLFKLCTRKVRIPKYRGPCALSECGKFTYLLTCTCVGIHLGRVGPVFTNWDDPVAYWGTPGLTFLCELTKGFHSVLSPSCVAENPRSRSALIVVAHVFSWPPVRLRHVRGGTGTINPASDLLDALAVCDEHRAEAKFSVTPYPP